MREERADAARNRRAILAATEGLLAAHGPQDISMEQVAAAAGVAKGTVFHRFGNRTGLMNALMAERAAALNEAVISGPPPLGPGAPDGERLTAFLDAIVEVVGRNKSLLAELGRSIAPAPDMTPDNHPVYALWHGHIATLLSSVNPGADAEMIAHLMLGSLHSTPILAQLAEEGPDRLARALRLLAVACEKGEPA
ncbi:TetR/AcrR family transcriptional regulator [Nonomuraea sp. NBC_01738]|uniref:TetR/AcrR family transcriptional regulator n=1 Tax=Nonomuraea sp. NBC_01738 TaxID=2976003 RepID=UPI002E136BF2|nr:TetR/AcrR family transcriptional regulator [Nonomuraea sp. NBC_01738]